MDLDRRNTRKDGTSIASWYNIVTSTMKEGEKYMENQDCVSRGFPCLEVIQPLH